MNIVAAFETILLIGVLITAGSILLTRRIHMAVGTYMVFSFLLAILWGIRYGIKPLVAELGVGVVVTGLLFYFVMRKLREEKGHRDE